MSRLAAWPMAAIACGALLRIAFAGTASAQGTHVDLMQQDQRARALAEAGKVAEAIVAAEALLERARVRLGPDNENVGSTHCFLGYLYNIERRFAKGEASLRRCVEIGRKHASLRASIAPSLANLANSYRGLGRLADAEATLNEAMTSMASGRNSDLSALGKMLCNLADLVEERGRTKDAEALSRRCIATIESAPGADERELPQALQILARALVAQGRLSEAEPVLRRSLVIAEKTSDPARPTLARSLDGLADLLERRGRHDEAEALYKRSLLLDEARFGPRHPFIGGTLNNLANIYSAGGRHAEAQQAQIRALSIFEQILDKRDTRLAVLLNNIGLTYIRLGDAQGAYRSFQRASAIQLAATTPLGPNPSWLPATMDGSSHSNLVVAAWNLADREPARRAALTAETFEAAQRSSQSEAGAALAALAARYAARNSALAPRIRQQQDLQAERLRLDAALLSAISAPSTQQNDAAAAAVRGEIAAVEAKLSALASDIEREVPAFRDLASPKPVALSEAQQLVRPDEALVLFLARNSEMSFVWVVTRSAVRWLRLPIGNRALATEVAALRCGLDTTSWAEPGCEALTGARYSDDDARAGRLPPFDQARAHRLYQTLLGAGTDLIAEKHLLLVLGGPLSHLPLQVLVTAPPVDGRAPEWLIRSHALSVLPSVPGLKSLRRNTGTSKAAEAFIGFGDPVLTGVRTCPEIEVPKSCPGDQVTAAIPASLARSRARAGATRNMYRDGVADVEAVRELCPLPDTAQELRCVARSLGAPPSSVHLAAEMTETKLKQIRLDHYRILHFATHGLLAAQTEQISDARAEPALVMTPPGKASAEDDGLLTASEIAALKLDADWVVMSACNTAASGGDDGEALSGLARSFLYAGARALLVSHWPVNSLSATYLTSRTFAELRSTPGIGRAEAFRRSMLALMSSEGQPSAAHPSMWAPFIIVGEGGTDAP